MRVKHHARMRDSKHRTDRRATDLISEIDDSRARVYTVLYAIYTIYPHAIQFITPSPG
jgi:hypothetical protein